MTLVSGFLRSAQRFPARTALAVAGDEITYRELRARAVAVAAALQASDGGAGPPLTAVFGGRSTNTFAAILGVLLRGHGYVPLNPRYPPTRNREILERAGCHAVVVDPLGAEAVEGLLSGLRAPPRIVLAEAHDRSGRSVDAVRAQPGDPAYLLFTSGSTGRPKGVVVTHANVRAFLDAIAERYVIDETARLSQLFDLTFDLSAFDMFVAWENGACVCCPAETHLLRPAEFVREAELTVWFSVPSVAMFMQRLGALKPGAFPNLRLSLFCGEALPAELATRWADAAPSSAVDNLYGPTEATIACTAHRWDPSSQSGESGLVPIGTAMGATTAIVVDDSLHPVEAGRPGQLVLFGPQVVAGYLDDEAATARAFVSVPGFGRGYLTGDRVVEPAPAAPLEYLGRLDNQIKVLGHRVELEEVEAVVREEAGAEAVAVGWPRTASGAAGIVAFVGGSSVDPVALRRALAARLPDYMVPRELHLLAELPVNENGKRDRNALVALLEAQ